MMEEQIITGKRILIVDDEQDVLEALFELLENCKLDKATDYQQAVEMIDKNVYDVAILDIMGVRGYDILAKANEKKTPAIMLTAHALSPENLAKAAMEGAAYYAPKEELHDIKSIVAEVLYAIENGKSPWEKMFQRLSGYYDKRFNGPDWRKKHKQFWDDKRNRFTFNWH
jgi:DNA-binding response OmpR family regulator